jgi:hypothetical protein
MTTLNDIIRRRTANKYAGTKLGTQIANEYETGSRAGQNLNPTYQRGQKPQKVGVKPDTRVQRQQRLLLRLLLLKLGMVQYSPELLKKLKRWIAYETKEGPRASMIEGYIYHVGSCNTGMREYVSYELRDAS